MRELTKDIELEGIRYQLRKFDARTGSWIAVQIASYLLPSAVETAVLENAAKTDGGGIVVPEGFQKNKRQMTETEFHNIQDHCLAVVSRYEGPNPLPVPIVHGSGRWAFPEMENDFITVLALTAQVLLFNMKSFFEDGRMERLMASILDGTKSFAEASSIGQF
jgi:Phage tail assembly chaperone protein, TAC